MKAVTALLVACALVMFFVSPAVAAKGITQQQPQTLVREVIPDPEPGAGDAAPTYARPVSTRPLVAIPPGTYTIGASGATYPTITAAVQALQANGVAGGGPVIFQFIDPFYTDTCQTIGGYPGQSPANPVIFRPAPATVVTIKLSPLSSTKVWGFRLDSAAGVTFDGSNSGGLDRSMTIVCDTATTFNMNAFLVQRGSQFITMKNMIVKGNRRAAGNGGDVIRMNNFGTTPAALLPQHDITVDNCWVLKGVGGIYSSGLGSLTVSFDYNMTFTNNLIGGAGSVDVLDNLGGNAGGSSLLLGYVNGALVDHNEIYGVKSITTVIAIRLNAAVAYATITNNKVHGIELYTGGAARPMFILVGNNPGTGSANVTSRALFANNMFYDMHNYGAGTSGRGFEGLFFNPTSGTTGGQGVAIQMINNTFAWMNIGSGEGGTIAAPGTCFIFDGNSAGAGPTYPDSLVIYNNIAATNRPDGFTRSFLIFTEGAPGMLKLFGNNNLFSQVDGGNFCQIPVPWPGGAATVLPSLADWQVNTGNDLNSKSGDAFIISGTNPHISQVVGDVSLADSLAIPWAGVTTDIDGQVRNAVKPDAGADEFTVTRFVNDLVATSFDYPPPTLILKAGGSFSAKATFANPGSATHAAAPVVCQIYNGATLVYAGTASLPIGGYGNSAQATFAPPASLPAGNYTVYAIAALPGDSRAANDTVVSSLFVQASISTLPYSINFESGAPGWVTNASAGSPNDWVVGTPAKTQIIGANGGTKCWVTGISGVYTSPQESFINLPILDLTTFTGTLLVQFYNNFYTEDTWDGGQLQMSLDGGLSWTKVDSTLGTPPTYNTPTSTAWYNQDTAWVGDPNLGWSGSSTTYSGDVNGWVRSSTAISGLAGLADVRFRWAFTADDNTAYDGWAIDDVLIKALEPNDISLASVGIPGYVGGPVPEFVSTPAPEMKGRRGQDRPQGESVGSLGAYTVAAPITLDAVVRNAGVNPQPSYSVAWTLDAVTQAPVSNITTLPFGGEATLPLTWATPTTGFHTVNANTVLGTDTNPTNDAASFEFEVLAPEVLLYEGFNGTTFPPAGWTLVNADSNVGSITNWYRSQSFPQEGLGYARDQYQTAGVNGCDDWLITPNTGSLLETSYSVDSLSFWLTGLDETFPDSLMVLVSTTDQNPASFTTVLGYVLAEDSNYTKYTFALPSAATRYIAFRYYITDAVNNADVIYLDNIRITRYAYANTFSATPGSLAFGALPIGFTSSQTVVVKNVGNLPLTLVSATSSDILNFGVTATPGAIPPGDSIIATVTFHPVPLAGLKSADIIFVHDGDSTPDTVTVTGTGTSALTFLSVVPDTIIAKDPVKGKLLKPVKRVKPGKPIVGPNWANLLDETVAQGGFRPGATESDSAGGMVVGTSFMTRFSPDPLNPKWKPTKDSAAIFAWVRLTKWDFKKSIGKSFNALQKTLEDKTGKHDLMPARGFDFTTDGKNKPLVKQMTSLYPKKQDNALYAQLVAVKLNIAASQLGKIPEGFGDLIYDRDTSMFDEQTIMQIAQNVDVMMTRHELFAPDQFNDAYTALTDINKAFVGPLDTVSFMTPDSLHPLGKLELAGQVNLATVPYVKRPTVFIATRMLPSTPEVESLEDFENDAEDVEGELPVAARLYQNYPNPFNPSTTIAFRLREDSKVTIRIFNLLGQQVATLIDGEEVGEGVQTVEFAATNLASGIYFYQIDAQGLSDDGMKIIETRKMMLVK